MEKIEVTAEKNYKISLFTLICMMACISAFGVIVGLQLVTIWEHWQTRRTMMTIVASYLTPVADLDTKLNNHILEDQEKETKKIIRRR